MGALLTSVLIEQQVGIETVIHYCCRDRNLLGMLSDLLGAAAVGLRLRIGCVGNKLSALCFERCQQLVDVSLHPAIGTIGPNDIGIFANKTKIEHGKIFFLSSMIASTISTTDAPGAYHALVPTSCVISRPPPAVRAEIRSIVALSIRSVIGMPATVE